MALPVACLPMAQVSRQTGAAGTPGVCELQGVEPDIEHELPGCLWPVGGIFKVDISCCSMLDVSEICVLFESPARVHLVTYLSSHSGLDHAQTVLQLRNYMSISQN